MNRSPSRRLPALLALVAVLPLVACRSSSSSRRDDVVPPFVFKALDLRQQTPLGQPSWELTSQEARYDLRRRLAQASRPRGVIYKAGKPLYRLQADSGTVLSDGEAILLEGDLRVQRLGPQPVLITASRARWLPRRQLLLIDRKPEAYDRQGRLRAERARFLLKDDRLELSGQPRLERWEQRFDPFATAPRPAAPISIQAVTVTWKPGSGELLATGPLQASRLPQGSGSQAARQSLTAASLQGNTIAQTYTLKGPVRFEASAGGESFSGQDLELRPGASQASTASAFEGSHGALQVSGTGLRIDGASQWLHIDSGCRIQRPGERLEAQRCGWNWGSGDVEASGGVMLERGDHHQVSRGEQLNGRLGENGNVRITAPGGRVVSRFQLPHRPSPAAPPRPAPPPIVP